MATISENTSLRSQESTRVNKNGAKLALEQALKSMTAHGFDPKRIQAAYTAVTHATTNAFTHGHSSTILFEYSITDSFSVFTIKDSGRGFHPHGNYPSGSGLALMHRLPDYTLVDSHKQGTAITMRFDRVAEPDNKEESEEDAHFHPPIHFN